MEKLRKSKIVELLVEYDKSTKKAKKTDDKSKIFSCYQMFQVLDLLDI